MQCGKCGQECDGVELCPEAKEAIPGSRGQTSMNLRCKFCENHSSIDVKQEVPYQGEQQGEQRVFVVEVRGSQKILDWRYACLSVVTPSGYIVKSEGCDEVADWDEKAELTVTIINTKYSVK